MLFPSRLTEAPALRRPGRGDRRAGTGGGGGARGKSPLAEPPGGRATVGRILRVPRAGSQCWPRLRCWPCWTSSLPSCRWWRRAPGFRRRRGRAAGRPRRGVHPLPRVPAVALAPPRAPGPAAGQPLRGCRGPAAPPLAIGQPLVAGAFLFVGGLFLGIGATHHHVAVATAVPAPWRGPALAVRLMGNRAGQVAMPLAAGVAASGRGPRPPSGSVAAPWPSAGPRRPSAGRQIPDPRLSRPRLPGRAVTRRPVPRPSPR